MKEVRLVKINEEKYYLKYNTQEVKRYFNYFCVLNRLKEIYEKNNGDIKIKHSGLNGMNIKIGDKEINISELNILKRYLKIKEYEDHKINPT